MYSTRLFALGAALLAAPTAHAQLTSDGLLSGVSSTCIGSVTYLVQSGFGTCANLFGAIPVLTSSGSLDSWLGTVCKLDNCSPALIDNATNIVEQGCKSDIERGNAIVASLVPIVRSFNEIKDGLCLRWRDNGTFCVTSQLQDLQAVVGTDLTLSTLADFNAADLANYPRDQACDDCSHALTTRFQPLVMSNNTLFSGVGQTIQNYCGDSFLDGKIPSTVLSQNDSSVSSGPISEGDAQNPASGAVSTRSVGLGTAAAAILAAIALA